MHVGGGGWGGGGVYCKKLPNKTYPHDIPSHLLDWVLVGQQAGNTALKQPGEVSKAEVKVQRG